MKFPFLLKKLMHAFLASLMPVAIAFFATNLAHAQTPISSSDLANDGSFLDPKYPQLKTVSSALRALRKERFLGDRQVPKASDTISLIEKQSPVKSQGARGTCSIFSATAMAESFLIATAGANTNLDLSEEWLELVIKRNAQSEGSSSNINFSTISGYGMASEESLPYIGETWENLESSKLASERCGHIKGYQQKSCLLGHHDPQLLVIDLAELLREGSDHYSPMIAKARTESNENRAQFNSKLVLKRSIDDDMIVKTVLANGTPLTLDVDFYYGAWNHRLASNFGMERNMEHWYQGVVGFPAPGSVDAKRSLEDPAGHSVLIVGYDDELEVEVPTLMQDGTTKNIKYKGVYYFKNSWGSASFGRDFKINGKPFPGYGMITQKYAHQYGQFFQFYRSQAR